MERKVTTQLLASTHVTQFVSIDINKWQRIKDFVKLKSGINITSDVGEATSHGIELSWSYNAQTLNLAITLVHRSFYDPSEESIVTSLIQWVNAA